MKLGCLLPFVLLVMSACFGQSFGTLTQYNSGTCSSGTSCNVSGVTLAAGDVVVITASVVDSGITISSVTGQTCFRTNSWAFSSFNGSMDQCVILSASAITNATLTVNFNATNGGGLINVRRYAVSGGTPSLDAVNSMIQSGASSVTNVPLTLSGTNALAVESLGSGCNSSSFVSAPWTDGTYLSGSGLTFCTADQINASSVTTPTWTGSGMVGTSGVALSFSPKTSVQYALMDSSGGTSGVEPTTSTLANSLYGAALQGSANVNVSFTVTDTVGSQIAYAGSTGDACSSAHHPLYGAAPRFLYSGITYPNTSSLGLAFSWGNTSQNATVGLNLPGAIQYYNLESPTVTMSADFCTTMLPTDSESGGEHTFTIAKSASDGPNLAIVANGSSLYFECEAGAGGSTCLNGLNSGVAATIPVSPGTWYKLNFQVNGGSASQSPSSPSSLSIGSNTITLSGGCPFNPTGPYTIAGTGTLEYVIPTATTCTSGGASGTITVTVVGSHSSGYTVQPADVATVLSDTGVLLGSVYFQTSTSASYAYLMRVGIPNNPSGLSGRTIYYNNLAYCYATVSPTICPTIQSPLPQYAWSGILSPARAINWGNAGLPATLPDGETTTNAWTPPTRIKSGSTINPSGVAATDLSNINTAMSSCTNGGYVLLGSGTFFIQGTLILNGHSCTLRGGGPQSSILSVSGSGIIWMGSGSGGGSCQLTSAANYSIGSTTVICNSLSGSAPVSGDVASLTQCDTGYTGTTCTGTATDNGGIYVCGGQSACNTDGSGPGNSFRNQNQTLFITSVTNNSGTYTVGLNTGLYMPNWAYARTPVLSWNGTSQDAIGVGLEDLTVYYTGSGIDSLPLQFSNSYASWVKGVRFVGAGTNGAIYMNVGKNDLISNSYFFVNVVLDSTYPPAIMPQQTSDSLFLNNMMMSESEPIEEYGGNVGNVTAYNFARDSFTPYAFNNSYDHVPFDSFELFEGNQFGEYVEDNTWGTHALKTYYRNLGVCYDSPYTTYSAPNPRAFQLDGYQRFMNVIGNAFGTLSQCSGYQSSGTGNIYQIATGDSLSANSLMRWGNATVVTQSSDTPANSGIRFVSSEVPTTMIGNAALLENSVPASSGLPCSFYFSGYASAPCSIQAGGPGFNWWKVCKVWSSFPSSCATTQTQPFPIAGPDQSGGPYVSGYGYDVPAAIAWQNLPIDTAYQNSYTISSSSWSGGIETLTFSGSVLPNVTHLMGPFQLSGVNTACMTGATFGANSEILMTGSSSTTVQYAVASNPSVSCTGTLKFPDVRQFDERVYQNDPAPGGTGGTSTGGGTSSAGTIKALEHLQ